jgi:micrococcal nuclease
VLRTFTALCLLAAALTASCSTTDVDRATSTPTDAVIATAIPGGDDAVVTRVVDGDTVRTDRGTIRLIGVDTPETVKPDSPVECFGPQASAATKDALPSGTRVRLAYDAERTDRYGRTLAYLYRSSDGLFVNAWLVRGGYGRVLVVRPNSAHATELKGLQQQARTERRGLWGAC